MPYKRVGKTVYKKVDGWVKKEVQSRWAQQKHT